MDSFFVVLGAYTKSQNSKPELKDDSPIDSIMNSLQSYLPQEHSNLLGETDDEKKEISEWLQRSLIDLNKAHTSNVKGNLFKLLGVFSKRLTANVFVANNKLSIADFSLFANINSIMKKWSLKQKYVNFMSLMRHYDFMQHLSGISDLKEYKVDVDKDFDVEELKKKELDKQKNKQKQLQQQKKNKQKKGGNKQPKNQAKPVDVSRLDLRVGKILSVKEHSGADTLYIEDIDLGEEKPRVVVSGLRNFIKKEDMVEKLIVVLANTKPGKLRGVLSEAMVVAASNDDHSKVELVMAPEGSVVGEKIFVEGYDGEPDSQLHPKKKIFEKVKPDLTTNAECVACYKGLPLKTKNGVCKSTSMANSSLG